MSCRNNLVISFFPHPECSEERLGTGFRKACNRLFQRGQAVKSKSQFQQIANKVNPQSVNKLPDPPSQPIYPPDSLTRLCPSPPTLLINPKGAPRRCTILPTSPNPSAGGSFAFPPLPHIMTHKARALYCRIVPIPRVGFGLVVFFVVSMIPSTTARPGPAKHTFPGLKLGRGPHRPPPPPPQTRQAGSYMENVTRLPLKG